MKARQPLLNQPLQLALQLDLFSEGPAVPPTLPPRQPPIEKLPGGPTASPPPPARPPANSDKRQILIQDYWLEYSLLRSKRRTIGFLINEDGLRMTAPRWVTIADIEQAIREKQRWIVSKLNERRERTNQRMQPQMTWNDGARLPYLGGDITLRIQSTQAAGVRYDGDSRELTVCLPGDASEQQLKDRVQSWLQQEAKRIFTERLPIYAEKLGVRYQSMSLSAATTRWGSCTAQGKIRLNWRLIHFSLTLIDYVIAHELSHLREMNHSPQFWATVQSIFPDFEQAKQALRNHAAEELPAF
ncbi:SprT family zinc-dependent metalloprotease [Undibacterium sp.]|uniref:M48 family metallopeptidase n=1 Tax=Undibacterium sp. TaxID=1914977 RepID=UPI002CB9C005|nr:SprT family zinc-dependent metalloprotease [Undibacterium sp.]HTD03697.1 SprT family zinc-dependent metalloprotease [Undibacterium sp.]